MIVYLLIFFIVAMPGIYLGEILIHFTDIYIFILFLYFFKWKLKTNIIQIWLFFYILAIISSIIVASFTSNIGISPVLKAVRIILACMIYPIVLKCHNYFVNLHHEQIFTYFDNGRTLRLTYLCSSDFHHRGVV